MCRVDQKFRIWLYVWFLWVWCFNAIVAQYCLTWSHDLPIFYKSALSFLFLMETDCNRRLCGKHWLLRSKFGLRKNKSTFEIEPTDSQIIGFLYPECFSEHNCERKDMKLYFNCARKLEKYKYIAKPQKFQVENS